MKRYNSPETQVLQVKMANQLMAGSQFDGQLSSVRFNNGSLAIQWSYNTK